MFPRQFGDAVDADRAGRIGFTPGSFPVGIEPKDEVGAEVEKSDARLSTVASEIGRADGVGGEGVGGVFLGLVDEVVGGGVDDGVPRAAGQAACDGFRVVQVEMGSGEADDLVRGEGEGEVGGELAS